MCAPDGARRERWRVSTVPYDLTPFYEMGLTDELLALLLHEHEHATLPRLHRLWGYYRNALSEPTMHGGSTGSPAQAVGLPARLTDGVGSLGDDRLTREIVVENDIAWRVHTLVDFMFPLAPKIISKARDPQLQRDIQDALNAVIESSGGISLWQDAALLGGIYGYVDFLVDASGLSKLRRSADIASHDGAPHEQGGMRHGQASTLNRLREFVSRSAHAIRIETVEATRAIPLLHRADYRTLDAYIIHYHQLTNDVERSGFVRQQLARLFGGAVGARRVAATFTEIHSATHTQRYENGTLIEERVNRLGRVPVIHVQNMSQPLCYEGMSDVEPLIPLQDELNTRLSDRANRVAMQSFRMYLVKGIDGASTMPIGPGQMWTTDNPDASIVPFGGDADTPSERAHMLELREALDRASGVTPAAAGHIRARVGNLTSENALRISLMGTIARIKRKRVTYGAGIEALCELVLHALDVHGVLRTSADDRKVEIVWADALPVDESRRITDALAKAQLGVPLDELRRELGYTDAPPASAQQATDLAPLTS